MSRVAANLSSFVFMVTTFYRGSLPGAALSRHMNRTDLRKARNRVSDAALAVGDKVNDYRLFWRERELDAWERAYELLPTPAKALEIIFRLAYRLAFAVSDPCPECKSTRCACVADVMHS